MSDTLTDKQKRLEEVELDNKIEGQRAEIAQKKAVIAEMKKSYGPDFKKILGIHPKKDTLQDLYAVNPELRNMSVPSRARR